MRKGHLFGKHLRLHAFSAFLILFKYLYLPQQILGYGRQIQSESK